MLVRGSLDSQLRGHGPLSSGALSRRCGAGRSAWVEAKGLRGVGARTKRMAPCTYVCVSVCMLLCIEVCPCVRAAHFLIYVSM